LRGLVGHMGETDPSNPKPWLRLCGLIVLALLLTAAVAYRSLEMSSLHGRLSVPPLFDDVTYFLAAAKWLNAAESQSVGASMLGLLHQHAPFSTLVAATGFRLVPDSYIGPYLVHVAVVFAFLLGIVWFAWKRPASEIATCLIAAACVPMVWHTVSEARPDLPWGLALGLIAGAILHRGALQRGAMSLAALGVACGLAVSLKPTAFPASIVLLGSVFAIRLVLDCLQSGGLRASGRSAVAALLWFGVGLVATAAVLIGPALAATLTYILNVFVYQRDIWTAGEGFWAGLSHYSVGNEGKAGLHDWFWVGVALMGLRLWLAATKGRAAIHDAAAVLAAVVIAYAIPSVAEIKTYFFGAIFYGVFIVALVMNFCAIEEDIESRLAGSRFGPAIKRHALAAVRLVPLVVVALLFGQSVVSGRVSLATPLTADQQDAIRGGTERVWSLLRDAKSNDAKSNPTGPLSVGFSSPYPVTPTTIQLYAVQARTTFVVRQEFFHRTVDETEKALLQSNILVISSSIPHGLPGPRVGNELIARMDANTDVCLLDSVAFPDVRLRVYRRPC